MCELRKLRIFLDRSLPHPNPFYLKCVWYFLILRDLENVTNAFKLRMPIAWWKTEFFDPLV